MIERDQNNLEMQSMPGFRIKWYYNIEEMVPQHDSDSDAQNMFKRLFPVSKCTIL